MSVSKTRFGQAICRPDQIIQCIAAFSHFHRYKRRQYYVASYTNSVTVPNNGSGNFHNSKNVPNTAYLNTRLQIGVVVFRQFNVFGVAPYQAQRCTTKVVRNVTPRHTEMRALRAIFLFRFKPETSTLTFRRVYELYIILITYRTNVCKNERNYFRQTGLLIGVSVLIVATVSVSRSYFWTIVHWDGTGFRRPINN